jgi:hypothetical protein
VAWSDPHCHSGDRGRGHGSGELKSGELKLDDVTTFRRDGYQWV